MIVVYTTIFGGSDSLKPAPSGADLCVLFTDTYWPKDLQGWQVRYHRLKGSPRRDAWHLRCIPHRLLPEATTWVWIDASYTLTDLPKLLEDAGSAPIAALRHQSRRSCYEEGRRLIEIGQADEAEVERQLAAYKADGFWPGRPLSMTGLLVRRNKKAVRQFNDLWDRQIQTYPGDNTQLSVDYCAWKQGLEIQALTGIRHKNPYGVHDWADHGRRRRPYREVAV